MEPINPELVNQVRAGEKLKALIEQNYGHGAVSSTWYQVTNASKIDFFVVAKKANLALQFKTFLGNNFGINYSNVNGVDTSITVAVSLSDISGDSLNRLRLVYKNKVSNENIPEDKLREVIKKIKFPQQKIEETSQIPKSSTMQEHKKEVKSVQPKIGKTITPLTGIDRFRSSFEVFLSQVSLFESKQSETTVKLSDLFSYAESSDPLQLLNCKDEVAAFCIEKAARYFVNGYKDSTVVRGVDIVRVDCGPFLSEKKERRPLMGSFCLPPNENSDIAQVKDRLTKIACMTRPVVEQVEDGFKVIYSMPDTAQKIYQLISNMGWRCQLEGKSILVIAGVYPVLDEIVTVETIKNETEKGEPSADDQVPAVKATTDPVSVPTPAPDPKPLGLRDLFGKDEVVVRFKEIYNNDDHWEKVSVDNRRKVKLILRSDLKNGDPENLASHLLNLSSEDRPLFSEEEALEEFNVMFTNPNFSGLYKPETQDKIKNVLKKNFINSDPDNFISEVVDLFVV